MSALVLLLACTCVAFACVWCTCAYIAHRERVRARAARVVLSVLLLRVGAPITLRVATAHRRRFGRGQEHPYT